MEEKETNEEDMHPFDKMVKRKKGIKKEEMLEHKQ